VEESEREVIINASLLDAEKRKFIKKSLVIENGKIVDIKDAVIESENSTDLKGKILLKPFCDYHIHAPGTKLYDLFGINLSEVSTKDYASVIKDYIAKGAKIVRGFGWDIDELETFLVKQNKSPIEFLNEISTDIPIVLFTLDFHSCWCNIAAVDVMRKTSPELFDAGLISSCESGLFHKHVAYSLFKNEALSFTQLEAEEAFLSFQAQAISYGIQEIYGFLFVGIDAARAWKVLQSLENKGLLRIKFNCTYDVYPDDTIEGLAEKIEASKKYVSKHIDFVFAKIYIDGVMENYTALLHEPYNDNNTTGVPNWEEEKLQELVDFFQQNNIPLHFHAIGDKATSMAVNSIVKSKKKSELRNTITHLQLCKDEDLQKMKDNDIVACFQPFWFFSKQEIPKKEIERLGRKRAEQEYPVSKLLDIGGSILFSSDCPVVQNFCPLLGIKIACETQPNAKERIYDYISAYQVGKYVGKSPTLKVGDNASFIILNTSKVEDIIKGKASLERIGF